MRNSTPRYTPNKNGYRCSLEDMHKNVHSSRICNNSALETLNIIINGKDKQISVALSKWKSTQQ